MPTVPKWIIESKDPDAHVTGDGEICKVLRETEKAVYAVVKYPVFLAPTKEEGHKFGTAQEKSQEMWVPKSQIDKVEDKMGSEGMEPDTYGDGKWS